ncbi:MAG: protein jag [Oscillospiraceae bacterium]|nr:protein jag [Oscillospiraceae bacterium]
MRETSIEVAGRTEDDAIQTALRKIGLDRDEVSVEIVERAKAGFLGIGATPAIVKVTYMTDAPEEIVPELESEVPVKAAKSEKAPAVKAVAVSGANAPVADRAQQFLEGLFVQMGTTAAVLVREEKGNLRIELEGPNMGQLIGRRGETLDAISHLTSYVVNRGADKRTRISVDAENYRKKREDALIRLAHKTAEKAVRYKKNMGLEPMNSYERHVIHAALQNVENVSTYSTGTEPNRRVFVAFNRTAKPSSGGGSSSDSSSNSSASPSARTHREWA